MDEKEVACLQAVSRAVVGMTDRERGQFAARLATYAVNVPAGPQEVARIWPIKGGPVGTTGPTEDPFRCRNCGAFEADVVDTPFVHCPKAPGQSVLHTVGHSWVRMASWPEPDRAAVAGGYIAPISGAPIEGFKDSEPELKFESIAPPMGQKPRRSCALCGGDDGVVSATCDRLSFGVHCWRGR